MAIVHVTIFYDFRIRGALGSLLSLGQGAGVLFGFIAGNYLSYETVPKVHLIFPVIFLVFYSFFPESPWFLIKQNKLEVRLYFSLLSLVSHYRAKNMFKNQ